MNSYLHEYLKANTNSKNPYAYMLRFTKRRELVVKYSWAIPDDAAIQKIVQYSPIIEVGAGTGYWASLIYKAGGDISCYDIAPPGVRDNEYGHEKTFYPVFLIDYLKWEKTHNSTLFLCWPPFADFMAANALKNFKGNTLIYIGESSYGCTADDKFFKILNDEWEEIDSSTLYRWNGIYDMLHIFRRK